MFYLRKNFDGEWRVFRLKGDDVSHAEDLTIGYGLKILKKIEKLAKAKKVEISATEKVALLLWSGLKFESFASDLIEEKAFEARKAKAEEEAQKKQASSK